MKSVSRALCLALAMLLQLPAHAAPEMALNLVWARVADING